MIPRSLWPCRFVPLVFPITPQTRQQRRPELHRILCNKDRTALKFSATEAFIGGALIGEAVECGLWPKH